MTCRTLIRGLRSAIETAVLSGRRRPCPAPAGSLFPIHHPSLRFPFRRPDVFRPYHPFRAPLITIVALGVLSSAAGAQSPGQGDSTVFAGVHWREIGPYRGGRSAAVAGNPSRPDEFWMGTPGGGVFKSI